MPPLWVFGLWSYAPVISVMSPWPIINILINSNVIIVVIRLRCRKSVMPVGCPTFHQGNGYPTNTRTSGYFFPEVKVARMDWDTTRGKWAFDKLIHSFAAQEVKILVSTQMIIKGLDFQNVHLVGVLNADHLMNFPDFRAHERTYQMLSQWPGGPEEKHWGESIDPTYQLITPLYSRWLRGIMIRCSINNWKTKNTIILLTTDS